MSFVINPFWFGGGGGPPPAAFSPDDLSGLALWLDADDATTITDAGAGAVSAWVSKDASARSFTQGTSGLRPTTGVGTLNSKNVIRFNADYLVGADAASVWKFLHDGTKHTVFAVVRTGLTADPNAVYTIYGTDTSSTTVGASLWYDDRASSSRNDVIFHQITRGSTPVTTLNLTGSAYNLANTFSSITLRADPSNATAALRSRIRRNARDSFEGATATGTASTANPTGPLHIGSTSSGTFPFVGEIAELIMYDRELTYLEEGYVHAYLGTKWALPLLEKWEFTSTSPIIAKAFGFPSVVLDGSTYVLYHHWDDGTVHRYTSSDGVTWTDTGAVLTASVAWEGGQVGVPQVWKEGATWNMLYRSATAVTDKTGLATSSDGITWTKYAGNPVLTGSVGGNEVTGVIKVGSTYYAWSEGASTPANLQTRKCDLFTSTDLITWTPDGANPVFTSAGGGCFCPHVFKHDGFYYMLMCRYSPYTLDHGILELWRDDAPTFYAADREYLGVVADSRDFGVTHRPPDVPHVMTTDIERDTLIGGIVSMYTSTGAGGFDGVYLAEMTDVDKALGL